MLGHSIEILILVRLIEIMNIKNFENCLVRRYDVVKGFKANTKYECDFAQHDYEGCLFVHLNLLMSRHISSWM